MYMYFKIENENWVSESISIHFLFIYLPNTHCDSTLPVSNEYKTLYTAYSTSHLFFLCYVIFNVH